MPPEARIAIIDDNKIHVTNTTELLEALGGHRIILVAYTLAEALGIVPLFKEKGVQVALVDGNLNPSEISGSDGKTVIKAIKSYAPEVKTIGISTSGSVEGADDNLNYERRPEDFVQLVTDI